jgi:hypothetical protein
MSVVPPILIPLHEVDVVHRQAEGPNYPHAFELEFFGDIQKIVDIVRRVTLAYEQKKTSLDHAHQVLKEAEQLMLRTLFSFVPKTRSGQHLYTRSVSLYSAMMQKIHPIRATFIMKQMDQSEFTPQRTTQCIKIQLTSEE